MPVEAWKETRFVRRLLRHRRWRQVFAAVAPRYMEARTGPFSMVLDLKDAGGVTKYILRYGTYAPGVTRIMRETVTRTGNVIDIGANIGYHSLLAATLTSGRVVSFEPERHNFELLVENVRRNAFPNIEPRREACGSAPGSLRLFLNPANAGDHRLYPSAGLTEGDEVPVVTVDDALDGITGVDFIKIDVQGFEGHVLTGMGKTLARNRGVTVVSEFWPAGLDRAGTGGDFCLDLMESLAFRWQVIDDLKDRIYDASREEVYARCGSSGFVDLIFRRP
jgi:FkbM family methyltransferase